MAVSRSTLVAGPAKLVRGSGITFSKEGFDVRIDAETIPIIVDGYGTIDERLVDVMAKVSFTPEGRWNAATRAFLWPYGALNAAVWEIKPTLNSGGTVWPAFIFGTGTDVPTLIHDSNSHLHTIPASAITKMPSIFLSATRTMIGDAEITGVRSQASGSSGNDWSAASSIYLAATIGGTFTDTTFAPSTMIPVQPYTAAWGALDGFTAIETMDGWTIDFDMQIEWHKSDDQGTIAGFIHSISAMASCTPITATTWAQHVAQHLIQGSGAARGRSMNAGASGAGVADLTVTGADGTTIVVIKNAALKRTGFKFGAKVLRQGEYGWVSTMGFTGGVAQPICTLAGV